MIKIGKNSWYEYWTLSSQDFYKSSAFMDADLMDEALTKFAILRTHLASTSCLNINYIPIISSADQCQTCSIFLSALNFL